VVQLPPGTILDDDPCGNDEKVASVLGIEEAVNKGNSVSNGIENEYRQIRPGVRDMRKRRGVIWE
jgi:hypothetical protein